MSVIGLMLLLAAAPASQPAPPIRIWFDQLADPDGDVRQKAVENLMGLKSNDLPALKKIVEESRPLRPSQAAVLQDIVFQIFIANSGYEIDPDKRPFLGLTWKSSVEPDTPTSSGLVVQKRIVGFDAYRKLRPGDVLLSIKGDDAVFDTVSRLITTIQTFAIGDTITLKVVRDGKIMFVPVELRACALGIDSVNAVESWEGRWRQQAEKYWEGTFAPVVNESRTTGN